MGTRIAFDWRALALGFVLALAGSALAADPGSRDDPLITVSYARQLASFQLRDVAIGQALILPPGAELVVISPENRPVNASGLGVDSHILINLTTGERVIVTALRANQHYLYAGPGELTLRFDAAVKALVRGAVQ